MAWKLSAFFVAIIIVCAFLQPPETPEQKQKAALKAKLCNMSPVERELAVYMASPPSGQQAYLNASPTVRRRIMLDVLGC